MVTFYANFVKDAKTVNVADAVFKIEKVYISIEFVFPDIGAAPFGHLGVIEVPSMEYPDGMYAVVPFVIITMLVAVSPTPKNEFIVVEESPLKFNTPLLVEFAEI